MNQKFISLVIHLQQCCISEINYQFFYQLNAVTYLYIRGPNRFENKNIIRPSVQKFGK